MVRPRVPIWVVYQNEEFFNELTLEPDFRRHHVCWSYTKLTDEEMAVQRALHGDDVYQEESEMCDD